MNRLIPSEPTNQSPEELRGVPEDQLDALLDKVEEKRASRGFEQQESESDVVDVFRGVMRQVYMPVFETLRGNTPPKVSPWNLTPMSSSAAVPH